jgi:hypothetical protein
MRGKVPVIVGLVLTVLDTLVLGIPGSILVVEAVREGRIGFDWTWPLIYGFAAAWLSLLVVWLAVGHLNRPRARVAWYCLLISLFAMLLAMGRPVLQHS